MRTFHVKQLACILLLVLACNDASAQQPPSLVTNEQFIEDLRAPAAFDPANPPSVLAFLLHRLPDEVRVYPTENYYYFTAAVNGAAWAGSLRFGPDERAAGKLELSLYRTLSEWNDALDGIPRAILGEAEGVRVTTLDPFAVRVTYGTRSVVFKLNDLSTVLPPQDSIAPEERFLGPIFDESALRFFLIFNSKLKLFHYVLDETADVSDLLETVRGSDRVLIGRRTGFAFYNDHLRNRKILIGVHEQASRLNTWLDGPFDQLPENFIKGDDLRDAIIASDPEARGAIDRLGHYLKEEGRYLIHPYMLYRKPADLLRIDACAKQRSRRPDTYGKCFVIEPDVTSLTPPPGAKR